MSHHRYPICPATGKVRFREPRDIKLALRKVDRNRARARLNEVASSRREIRGYNCSDCSGWHLTAQPDRPSRLVPVAKLTVRIPGPATEAIRRIAAATGLTASTAV